MAERGAPGGDGPSPLLGVRLLAPSWDGHEHDDGEATGVVAGVLEHARRGSDASLHRHSGSVDDEALAEDGRISPGMAMLTLLMSVVGTGLLSLPYAFKCVGAAQGLVYLGGISVAMFFTGDLMLRSYIAAPGEADSYEALAAYACSRTTWNFWAAHPRAARLIVTSVNGVGLFGGCCAYITIGRDLLPGLIHRMDHESATPWYLSADFITFLCVACISLPLSLKRDLSSLRFTSIVGFCFSLYMILLICARGFTAIGDGTAKWSSALDRDCPEHSVWNSFAAALSVFNFSFVFHFNILPLFRSLPHKHQTLGKMRLVLVGTTASCYALYGSLGVTGFALFGAGTSENILNNFAVGDAAMNAAKAAITACCYLCLPLLEHPLRRTALSMLELPSTQKNRVTTSVVLITAQFVIALMAPSIKVVFQVTGGSAVVGFCFVFPIVFALVALSPPLELPGVKHAALSRFERWLCVLMLAFFPFCGLWSVMDGLLH